MKHWMAGILLVACLFMGGTAMATEEAKYTAVLKDGDFEIRNYDPSIVAEVVVKGDMEDAGNKAFQKLFGYISGKNKAKGQIAMTAPVSQEVRSQKIAMTAPVGQQVTEAGDWAVSFMMPASFTMETIPAPEDSSVVLREIPARRVAAVRYSGVWSEKGYLKHKALLEAWITKQGLTVAGTPVWARYNPPFTPWFMRRNEVLIPVR